MKFHQVESSGLESPGSGSGSWLEGAKPATPGPGRSGRFWKARWPSEAWALSCKVALPSVQAAPLPGEAGTCCAFLGRRRLSLECHLHVSLSLPTPMSSFVWAVSSRVSPDSSDALHVKQRPFPRLSPTCDPAAWFSIPVSRLVGGATTLVIAPAADVTVSSGSRAPVGPFTCHRHRAKDVTGGLRLTVSGDGFDGGTPAPCSGTFPRRHG